MKSLSQIFDQIHSAPGWKIFTIGGIVLIIFGEGLDLLLTGQFNLWVQVVILLLMAVLLIYTMNKK